MAGGIAEIASAATVVAIGLPIVGRAGAAAIGNAVFLDAGEDGSEFVLAGLEGVMVGFETLGILQLRRVFKKMV